MIKSDDPAFWGNLVHLNMTTDDKILWLLDSKMPQRMAHQLYMLRLRMSHAVMKALDKAQKFFCFSEQPQCSTALLSTSRSLKNFYSRHA